MLIWGRGWLGIELAITVEHREIAKLAYQKFIPYNAGNTNTASIPIFPATLNVDEYVYAQTLVLHPSHLAAGTTALDWTFPKAVPTVMPNDADGEKEVIVVVEYTIYPDRASLPALVYGWQGPAA